MGRIRILPPEVANKIAAGEVVERPLSVVKELVENSLDAGAREVKVELGRGGKAYIRVSDNGHGMTSEEARLCFERHSTSKIATEKDLTQIVTLGFRGEALPSISAVARVRLKTSPNGQQGTLIEREGDTVRRVEEVACPRGTIIEVRDLFFNLPARRKFLRSETTELGRITRLLISYAQAFPQVRFILKHGTREIFNYPPVGNLRERLFQIYGQELLERLVEVDFQERNYRLFGFVSRPPFGRGDRSRQFCYINRRWVADKLILAALSQSFQGWLEKGRHPEAWLFLEVPPEEVDVNVHPAKAEVRFQHPQEIFRLIHLGLDKVIRQAMDIKPVASTQVEVQPLPKGIAEEHPGFKAEEKIAFGELERIISGERKEIKTGSLQEKSVEESGRIFVLGQYLGLYIIAASAEGLLIIDQHNAHERVLFDRYLEIYQRKEFPRKSPLFPLIIDLSPDQEIKIEKALPLLERAGFRLEPMGTHAYALQEFPDVLTEEEAKDVLTTILEELQESRTREKFNDILATLACKTAVKAGELLSHSRMQYLVEELFKTSNPSLCPHGRPVMVKLAIKEIEKALGRR
jgi:DNA mismatch repair protein MutL